MKMRALIAFTKKELTEYTRTYKLLIVAAVFLLFGMMNPITAKLMPDIVSSLMPDGMTITLNDPSAIDSWMQFYKNLSIQLILYIIVFSGTMAGELSTGTLINILTKGLSRKTVILSKFAALTFVWTAGYLICFGTTLAYTLYLLPGALPNLFFSAFCMWLFGLLLLSVMLLGSVFFGTIYGSLLLTGGFTLLLMLLALAPKLQKYNPYLLSSGNIGLLTSEMGRSDFTVSIIIACIMIPVLLLFSISAFNRKQV